MSAEQKELFPVAKDENEFIIKFETTEHSLDAVLMGNTLLSFNSSLISFAQAEHLDNPQVCIRDVKSGCIEIGAILATLQTAGATVDYIATLCDHLRSLYKLYLFLKGQPPQRTTADGAQIHVENHWGENATFSNCVIHQYLGSQSPFIGDGEMLLAQQNIARVSILDGQRRPILSVPKEEFRNLIPYRRVQRTQDTEEEEEVIDLTVATVNLNNPRQTWSFIANGLKVPAKIEDEEFIRKIELGAIAFRQGDKIQCQWKITKRYDAEIGTSIIKRRSIQTVLHYTPRNQYIEQPLPGI